MPLRPFSFVRKKYPKRSALFWLTSSLLIHQLTAADQPNPQPLRISSPEVVVELALLGNRDIRSAYWQSEEAQARAAQAGRWANPTAQIAYSSDHLFTSSGEQTWGLSVSQPLPLANRLPLERRTSQAILEETRVATQQDISKIVLEALDQWYAIGAIEQRGQFMTQHLDQMEQLIEEQKDAEERGEMSRLLRLRTEMEREAMIVQQSRIEQEMINAGNTLAGLLGLPADQRWTFEFHFSDPLTREFSDLQNPDLSTAPALRLAKARQRSATSSLDLARARQWNDIEITLAYEEEREGSVTGRLTTTRFAGIALAMPLPLWNRGRAEIQEVRTASSRAQENAISEQSMMAHAAAQMRQQALSFREEINQLHIRSIKPARHYLAEVEEAAAVGEVQRADLYAARKLLLQAKEEQSLAIIRFYREYTRLQALLGTGPFARIPDFTFSRSPVNFSTTQPHSFSPNQP